MNKPCHPFHNTRDHSQSQAQDSPDGGALGDEVDPIQEVTPHITGGWKDREHDSFDHFENFPKHRRHFYNFVTYCLR